MTDDETEEKPLPYSAGGGVHPLSICGFSTREREGERERERTFWNHFIVVDKYG